MITTPSIIITSIGRTGTKFFYTLFDKILDDCRALHEPDVFNVPLNQGPTLLLHTSKQKLAEIGWRYLILQKLRGKFSIVKLSDARLKASLSSEATINKFLEQRYDFVTLQQEHTFMESSLGYYGLIDLLPGIFDSHRLGYIVRDGREWVRSFLNWGEFYKKSRTRALIAHTWPRADQLPNDPYFEKWDAMTRFERLCWAWCKLNNYALESISKNPHAQLFRFEDLFTSEERYDHLSEFVSFLTEVHDSGGVYELGDWLEKKVHESKKMFPDWTKWSSEEKRIFCEHCEATMHKLSYEI